MLLAAVGFLAAAAPLADPDPDQARANLPCAALSPASAVTEIAGIGNPVSDACEAVTDPILGAASEKILGPLKDAANSIGKGVFNKVTSWVADGAVWLIGEVAVLSDKTTTPNLLSKGFLRQYKLMTTIAAFMAAVMLIFAVFEALGRGQLSMIWRVVLINVPLAAIATTAAYVVVQLLIVTCDGLCQAISHSAGADSKEFFKGAIEALAKAGATPGAVAGTAIGGAAVGTGSGEVAGAAAVPLFVGFIAAIVAAFAAFFVWIELLMRDAAIYVVALFMPLAIAASIWPRWVTAMRRTCELLLVIIFSKFVIVAIVSLAASLLAKNEGEVEHVLAAGAMLLLACFAPFVLFKLVPFAEGAASAAFSRQSAGGGAVRSVEFANSMMMAQRMSRANWAAGGGGQAGAGGSRGRGGGAGGGGGKRSSGGGAGAGGEVATGGAAAGAVPLLAAGKAEKSGQSGAERLTQTGAAKVAEGEESPDVQPQWSVPAWGSDSGAGAHGVRGAKSEARGSAGDAGESPPAHPSQTRLEPKEASGGGHLGAGESGPPRPASEKGTSGGREAKR